MESVNSGSSKYSVISSKGFSESSLFVEEPTEGEYVCRFPLDKSSTLVMASDCRRWRSTYLSYRYFPTDQNHLLVQNWKRARA